MPDKKGFTLHDGKEFFYDAFGGWLKKISNFKKQIFFRFDEEKNYYNSKGQPSSPPKTEENYEDEYEERDYGNGKFFLNVKKIKKTTFFGRPS